MSSILSREDKDLYGLYSQTNMQKVIQKKDIMGVVSLLIR